MKNETDRFADSMLKDTAISSPAWAAVAVTDGKWQYTSHLSAIDKLLVAAANRKIKKLIINMPPRHGKSELISKYFTMWYLGNFPDHRIILASYESSFAASWGRKTRDLIKKHGGKLFGISIDPKHSAADDFSIEGHEGGMYCAGAGGAITGKGADLLIIDDPVKNDAEAHSAVIRDNIYDWFGATAFTRLEPCGVCIIVMTRWHEDDICGRLSKSGAKIIDGELFEKITGDNVDNNDVYEDWLVLMLPAIARGADPLGRKPGEPLWKRRFSLNKLEEIKKQLGSYWFASLYQQEPAPFGGGIIKRSSFRYFNSNGELFIPLESDGKPARHSDCSVFAVADLAARTSEKADYTVVLIFAVSRDRRIFVIDIIREKFEGADHLKLLRNVFARYKPTIIGIEAVQYQISLVQSAMREGLPVKELKADKDKLSRLLPMAARLEAGGVYFRKEAPWLDDFENELLMFPNGKNDDQTDAFAYIGYMIQPSESNMPVGVASTKNKHSEIFKKFV